MRCLATRSPVPAGRPFTPRAWPPEVGRGTDPAFNRADRGNRLGMTNRDEGVWRDEEKLPLSDLVQAMATYSQDGQVDDLTGSDAGAEAEFGDGATTGRRSGEDDGAPGDADPTSAAARRLRPSPDGTSADGRSGPN